MSETNNNTPPKSRVRATTPPGSAPKRTSRATNKLRDQLVEFFQGVSTIPAFAGDDFSAEIIANRAEPLADAYAELAEKNPQVRKVLTGLVEGSAWTGAVMVTLSVVIPIAWRYNLFVPDHVGQMFTLMAGVVPPSEEVANHAAASAPKTSNHAADENDNENTNGNVG